MTIMFIDTHAHLMFKDFNGEVDAVIKRAKSLGVEQILNVGCSLLTSNQAIEMAEKYDCLYATLGLHPYDSPDATEELMEKWEKLILENKKIVAIGECGLDYFKARISKEIQKNAFRLQLKLAQKTGLPVIIHAREADDDCLEILEGFPTVKAVLHCFGSNLEFAKRVCAHSTLKCTTWLKNKKIYFGRKLHSVFDNQDISLDGCLTYR